MKITKKIAQFFCITAEDESTRYSAEYIINNIRNSEITLEVLQELSKLKAGEQQRFLNCLKREISDEA